jgi:hypothetical protein
MKIKRLLIAALSLVLVVSSVAAGDKKKPPQRGMLESMQSVPCGAKERGLTGLGSMVASVGVEHVNSQEQLCPQYLLRTDEMDYHIRPVDTKHAVVLPIGREAEFKIKKDRLFLRVVDGDKKALVYQVVAMQPVDSENKVAYRPDEKPADSRPSNLGIDTPPSPGVDKATNHATDPQPPQSPPQ